MSTVSAPPIPVGPLYGSMYFSSIISTAFYGIMCMQVFFYYVHYQNEPLRMKSFVAILWALNTIHQAITLSGTWKYTRQGLEDPATGFLHIVPELLFVILLTTVISLPTQGYFIYRIYTFSGRKIIFPLLWIPAAIYLLVNTFLYLARSVYLSDGQIQTVAITTLDDSFFTAMVVSYCAVVAAVDTVIAISLTILLTRKLGPTSFRGTAKTLYRLMIFAINTGIWTALFALLSLILVQVYPSNFNYAIVCIPLCSLYCNALLANLNARTFITGQTAAYYVDTDLFSLPETRHGKGSIAGREPATISSQDQGVWKTTEVEMFPDRKRSASVDV